MRDKFLVTPREAAWFLGGISVAQLRALTHPSGPIPAVRLGRRIFYDPDDLREYLVTVKREQCGAGAERGQEVRR